MADIVRSAPDHRPSEFPGSGRTLKATAGETIEPGQAVVLNADGLWYKATSAYTDNAIGIALKSRQDLRPQDYTVRHEDFNVMLEGEMDSYIGMTSGAAVRVSAAVAGELTHDAGSGKVIGFADSNGRTLIVHADR